MGWIVSKIIVLSCWLSGSPGCREMPGLLVLLWVMELHMEHQNKNACPWFEWLSLRGQHCVLSQVYVREGLQLILLTNWSSSSS